MTMKSVSWSFAGLVTMAFTVGVATCALVSYLWLHPAVPSSLAPAVEQEAIPVTSQEYKDPQAVAVTLASAADSDVPAPRDGLVTSATCAVGSAWKSGESNLAIDGEAVINLNTRTPLWRELAGGETGADVDALKLELNRLGFKTTRDASFGWNEVQALRELAKRAGAKADFTSISPTQLVWIPATEVSPKSCDVYLGQRVSSEASLFTVQAAVQLTVAHASELLPGARQLVVDGVEILLDETLSPADANAGTAVMETMAFKSAVGDAAGTDKAVTLTATVELVEPISTSALPPSAIHTEASGASCVRSGNDILPVKPISSEMGRTLVLFDGVATPEAVSTTAPKKCV